jgi:RNA polymerase sigma-70 factor (ECF subfamily)
MLREDCAFDTLYRRYREEVYRYLLARTAGDWALVQDLTSETFLRVYRSLDRYTDRGLPVKAWLVTIARNLVLDHLKSGRTRHEASVDWDDLAERWLAPADPEADAIRRDLGERLCEAMLMLPGRQGQCLFLRFMIGLSVEQTARTLHLNVTATRATQHRAVRKLAQLLAEPGEPSMAEVV